MKPRVHLRTPLGGNACRVTVLKPLLSDDRAEVTCLECLLKFRKRMTPDQKRAGRRRGGRAAKQLPECSTTFVPQQEVPLH